MPPTVSVIIPCYNLGQYVDEAVDSVLAQTSQDFEIIIVNDGSTDPATNALLAQYDRPHTRVLTTENRGLAKARNLAVAHAQGEYLCALDADDKLAPTAFERTIPLLDRDPEIAFVSFWLQTFGSENWVWKQSHCDLATLLGECTVCTAALVRRKAVEAVGGYDEGMPDQGYEDWDLWISLVENGFTGIILPEILFFYRRRPGSMSSICCFGDPHLRLMEFLVRKHAGSYRAHVLDVLLAQDKRIVNALHENDSLERHIAESLQPEVERREEELQLLEARLADHQRQQQRERLLDELMGREESPARLELLERELSETHTALAEAQRALTGAADEVRALRSSRSWKLAAPLRAAQDLLTRFRARP